MQPATWVEKIVRDVHTLGVSAGDILLVHSSLKSLGQPGLAPEQVIQALLAAVGPQGTLLMPALSYLQQPHAVHDSIDTPACVGIIPETFRRRPGTRRSLHPTHSMCGVGPAVAGLIARHAVDATPCGAHSPFRLILDTQAKILMLGCGLRPNTSMHAIEELVEPPYLFGGYCEYQITPPGGQTYRKVYRQHGFAGWIQRYDRISQLNAPGLLAAGRVLQAEAYLIQAGILKAAALAALNQNPYFFVDCENDATQA